MEPVPITTSSGDQSPKSPSHHTNTSFDGGDLVNLVRPTAIEKHRSVLYHADDEIVEFTEQIMNDTIKISNEKDLTIVKQLIEYIESLLKDKESYEDRIANLNSTIQDLKSDVLLLREENIKLEDATKIQAETLEEDKATIMNALQASFDLSNDVLHTQPSLLGMHPNDGNSLTGGNNSMNNVMMSLGVLSTDDIMDLKDNVGDQMMRSYEAAVDEHAEELRIVEAQLYNVKNELERHNKELSDRDTLEGEVKKLKGELLEARNSQFKKIAEKDSELDDKTAIIDDQLGLIDTMKRDINNLENMVEELEHKLDKSNYNSQELQEQIKLQQDQIMQARRKRAESSSQMMRKFSHVRSFSKKFSMINENELSLAAQTAHATPNSSLADFDSTEPVWENSNLGDFQAPERPNLQFAASDASMDEPVGLNRAGSMRSFQSNFSPRLEPNALMEKVTVYEKQIEELKHSKQSLMDQITAIKHEMGKLNDENDELNEEIDDLKEQLLDAQNQNNTLGRDRFESDSSRKPLVRDEEYKYTNNRGSCVLFGKEFW